MGLDIFTAQCNIRFHDKYQIIIGWINNLEDSTLQLKEAIVTRYEQCTLKNISIASSWRNTS